LELLALLPEADEINKTFYANVWQSQEIQHGLILDRLQQDLDRTAAKSELELSLGIKILGALAPFEAHRVMREKSYHLVGTNRMKRYQADMGRIMTDLGLDDNLEGYAREVGRVENRLLWAHKQRMEFPPYILKALKESVDLYRERLERGLTFA
jgi:hypothetical protein